jgi:hypothetical protein
MNNTNKKRNIWTIIELLTVYCVITGISLFLENMKNNNIVIYFTITITTFTILIGLTWKMNTLLIARKSDKYYRNIKIILFSISIIYLVTMMIVYQP